MQYMKTYCNNLGPEFGGVPKFLPPQKVYSY